MSSLARAIQAAPSPSSSFFGWVTTLVHRHRHSLLRLARQEGLAAEEAFDCVQEAFCGFLQLPRARPLVDSAEHSAALLRAVVRNVARNWRRHHRLARPHLSAAHLLADL